ncbi:unnamed protein product [Ostreobium quekettii]|uniref:Malic enzyme n=1 Tax=Ostreobium quekettii TaxID=121088 RepID=A0A8S1J0M5_9CHLO|nr:unnamed protein product [Ostreobium quekettii]|eukprot:evm.model.scf_992.5 EVM.evm.TU.scf_992.5   scf_992:25232-26923(-)
MADGPGEGAARTASMVACDQNGSAPLIWNPVLNRGTRFSRNERLVKNLLGLIPPAVESLELQAERVMSQLREASKDIDKYTILNDLATANLSLFYKVLVDNLVDLLPIVYTPTVGQGCMEYGRLFRSPLGMYFSGFDDKGRFREMLDNWYSDEVDIIVVTDGGRILGLGDLGTNGMGISVGKISLYVAGAGFHPERALPVTLDCGTDRKEMLEDKFYLGKKVPRLRGDAHMEVVEEFCLAVKEKWPNCLVQFEDFQTERAFAILDRMRDRMLCFNDDIQGTGAVVLSGFINGMRVQKTDLSDARVVFYGAGSSACGVAGMIAKLIETEAKVSSQEAFKAVYLVDSKGLITNTRGDKLAPHKVPFARTDGTPNMTSLVDIIAHVKPHALFGLSGSGPSFDKGVIEEVCKYCARPLIFPLSNPTSKAEITAENAIHWSKGKAIFAAGSPFPEVEYEGKTYKPGQANNVFIFPGVGFGAVNVKATKVTDEMLVAAAKALAKSVFPEELERGQIYPEIQDLRKICVKIAAEVGKCAMEQGVARLDRKPFNMAAHMLSRMWTAGVDDE